MSYSTFEITGENFQKVALQSALPVLVDFGADWCPPCKMIAPFVDELARKYEGKLAVGSLDVDAHPDIMERYGVMGLPTSCRTCLRIGRDGAFAPSLRLAWRGAEGELNPHGKPTPPDDVGVAVGACDLVNRQGPPSGQVWIKLPLSG